MLFGGQPLKDDHSIPSCYGSWEPTAVFVPIAEAFKEENFGVVTTELFGPFQVVTEYDDSQLDMVLEMCVGPQPSGGADPTTLGLLFSRQA